MAKEVRIEENFPGPRLINAEKSELREILYFSNKFNILLSKLSLLWLLELIFCV